MEYPTAEPGSEGQGPPESPAAETAPATEHLEEPDGERVIADLRTVYESRREEFFRIAAVRDLPPDVKQSLLGILTLSAEALDALREALTLPESYRRAIVAALDLPEDARVALRGLLANWS
jgi:hypothetical protein